MTVDEAIRILDRETSQEEIERLKYIAGFDREKVVEQIAEAMQLGAEALKKQIELHDKINILSLPVEDSSQEEIRKCIESSLKSFVIEV